MACKGDDRRRVLRRQSDHRLSEHSRRDTALDHLRPLYEISRRLADFRSVEETLPKVLAAVRRVLPFDSAVLILETGGAAPARSRWTFRAATPEAVGSAEAHADAAFAYLLDRDLKHARLDPQQAAAVRPRSMSLRQEGHDITLPLVVDRRAFGVLQLEGLALDEVDLHFVNAVVYQLAVALQRKRAEEEREILFAKEREARAEADAANRAKDDFLATLSHELRTPLNAIVGWVGLLLQGSLDGAEETMALKTIHRNALAQNQLVADILDVQSIVSGQFQLDVGTVDLRELVRGGVDTLKLKADAKRLDLRVVIESGVGPISGDSHRLRQVIWNLLSNAIKFTPEGGYVETRVRAADAAHVEISVSDSGPGIPANFLPHIFDRFRQGDGSARRRHGGLGLGLAIVRHIVDLHGGAVQAANSGEAGKGAVFSVKLPRVAATASSALTRDGSRQERRNEVGERRHETGSAEVTLEGVRVLLVDDSADDRIVLTHALEQWRAEVMVASSAAEGLAALERELPDILVSDIGMPDEDGYSFIRRVRELPPNRGGRTPAVALTAFARENDRKRALDSGFEVHIAKPVEPAALAIALGDLLCAPRP
jgi:signal transduction histidine kinase/CheY-like chemotaxis protein